MQEGILNIDLSYNNHVSSKAYDHWFDHQTDLGHLIVNTLIVVLHHQLSIVALNLIVDISFGDDSFGDEYPFSASI